jgi:tripartite-type tricarboxylate transporter receptor subunit TctC
MMSTLPCVCAQVLTRFFTAAALAVLACAAQAQGFPSKPVTMVVPFPPGAGPDIAARVIGEKLSARIGQPVVVENRPGVGGFLGASAVAKAPADGHTLLLTPNTLMIAAHVLPKGSQSGVDVTRDFTPVIMPATTPMLVVVNPELGVKSLGELVAAAKKTPGLPYGTAGNGSPMHVAGELFKKAAGVDMLHVPYKGVAPSVNAALAGEVKVLYVALGGVAGQLKSGKLVPLAVAERKRTSLLPDLPTFEELGYKGVDVNAWYGILAPAGTPADVVARLNREINEVLAMPDVRTRLNTAGLDIVGGSSDTLAAAMRADNERYARIVKEFDIKPD